MNAITALTSEDLLCSAFHTLQALETSLNVTGKPLNVAPYLYGETKNSSVKPFLSILIFYSSLFPNMTASSESISQAWLSQPSHSHPKHSRFFIQTPKWTLFCNFDSRTRTRSYTLSYDLRKSKDKRSGFMLHSVFVQTTCWYYSNCSIWHSHKLWPHFHSKEQLLADLFCLRDLKSSQETLDREL